MDIKIETDIMSKIMNRHVGNRSKSCETSPMKQQAIFSPMVTLSTASVDQVNVNESVEGDEVDGFVEDKVEDDEDNWKKKYQQKADNRNSKGINFGNGYETDMVDLNVEINGGKEDVDNDFDENEVVKREHNDTKEPRVEMFDEYDSNSCSNPFVISSFQSLNASEARILGFDIGTAENDRGVMDVKYGDKIVYEEQGLADIRIESEDHVDIFRGHLNMGESEHGPEFDNDDSCRDGDENSVQSFDSKRSDTEEYFNKIGETLCKHTIEKTVPQSCDYKTNCNLKDNRKEKSSLVKKSRKQNVPKRVKKAESFMETVVVDGEENVEIRNNDDDFDAKMFKQNGIGDCFSTDIDDINVNENHEESKSYKETGILKSEKSRKQCKPKRIDQLQNLITVDSGTQNQNLDIENDETETFEINFDTGQNPEKEEGQSIEFQNDDNYSVTIVKENDSTDNFSSDEKHDVPPAGLVKGSEDLDPDKNESEITEELKYLQDTAINVGKTDHLYSDKDESKVTGELKYIQDTAIKVGKTDHFASMSSNPFYYGFSPNLNVISTLSPGMLQGGCPSSQTGFALDENGPENLEVIRQLREIRCNRYRKISIAEKREISAYASSHGVSQAAAFYNVSKSAVSMWTKLDFSNADEECSVKRKNCMSGNEKFEALCRKVKSERENKFKGMSKDDKFEVSRYAKLVGVREMSRCLGVALGTVSGWMRQFPYKVESDSPDETVQKKKISVKDIEITKESEQNEQLEKKRKKSEPNRKRNKKLKLLVEMDTDSGPCDINQETEMRNKHPVEKANNVDKNENKEDDEMNQCDDEEVTEEVVSEHTDDVDKMIAETWQKPDIDKCFEEVRELIKDSPLEDDDFFRSLFGRVLACRAEKYKTLKPSEKLEVVRYAKRIGVRRVAKIMGLATGTLSGWNTKYQSSLSITDPSLEMSNKTELLVSYLSPDKNTESESAPVTPVSLMDNMGEKSEVTAVKLLFKDRFQTLLQKIKVAKQVKFRNISTEEKIEFVKCSKLVGIRPTARVFGIPIGTLSGWISKYSKLLHPPLPNLIVLVRGTPRTR
ncbi:uncharacterized protein LOC132740341 [Ruditapes philippinarum]|uniref:uncharacterized protein LOC132740341 n=1 Tax=Ruditapes philippinarum TaxID=129788 RepID=UPI00295A8A60|nr:uncharacterized protein LOC132740341 [Ruditapes philippinarum]